MITDFSYQTIVLADDYEGKVIATLIASNKNIGNRPATLYLHGFIDYFFHPHVADAFLENGYDFYALELRKYGHSLLPHQHPNYCRNIKEYFEELSIVLKMIYEKSNSPITLLGHSMGGLIATLYMNMGENKQFVNKLILNSPFLEFNTKPKIIRTIGKLIAKPISTLFPYANLKNAVNPIYPKSLHKDYYGEWDFNLKLKPIEGFPAYFSWIHAIEKAQKLLKKSAVIPIPILILHASKSFIPRKYSESVQKADIVLDVKDMRLISPKLGRKLVIKEIVDAKHDVFLSQKDSRETAFKTMLDWLNLT